MVKPTTVLSTHKSFDAAWRRAWRYKREQGIRVVVSVIPLPDGKYPVERIIENLDAHPCP